MIAPRDNALSNLIQYAVCVLCVACLNWLGATAFAVGFTITDLGAISGSYSLAYGINSNGVVTGESSSPANFIHGFLYQTNMVDITPTNSTGQKEAYASAHWINNSNQVTGELYDNGNDYAFVYRNGARTILPTLGGSYGGGYGINNSGQVVGLSLNLPGFVHAFLYSPNGSIVDLGTLGGTYSGAFGINDQAHVVGESDVTASGPTHAFFYDGFTNYDLGTFGGPNSSASCINNADQIVGYATLPTGLAHAFLYQNSTMTDLGVLPGGSESVANAINNNGQVVGYVTFIVNGATNSHAFYYDGSNMADLNGLIPVSSGWSELTAAQCINTSKQIVGYGVIGNGTHGFLLTPSTNTLLSFYPIADRFMNPGDTLNVTNAAIDPVNTNAIITYSFDSAPPGMTIDSNTGVVTWIAPSARTISAYKIVLRATENTTPPQTTTANLNITVSGVPRSVAMTANSDNTISLSWNLYPSSSYTLQIKTNLQDAQWTPLLTGTSSSSSTLTLTDNPLTNTQRFYQLTSAAGTSDTVGFIKVSCLGVSDTFLSIPFARPTYAVGQVASISGNAVAISGAANLSSNQLVYVSGSQPNTYYLRFDSGAWAGHCYAVASNDISTVYLNLGADSLASVVSGDLVSIIPYWTFNSVFPNGAGVNASLTSGNRNTEVLVPNVSDVGINLSPAKTYYFNGGFWKQFGLPATDHGNDTLPANAYVIVRNNVATNTTVVALGSVVTTPVALPLATQSTGSQDNAVGLSRPVALSLDDSQLFSSGGFVASPLPGTRTDELLTFDNTIATKNKSASAVYYYWSGAWRQVGQGTVSFGTNQIFTPGIGVIVRKASNNIAPTWINTPNY